MDRRAFLYGTAASIGTGLMLSPAASDTGRIQMADLRGSLAAEDFGITAGSSDDQSQQLQTAVDTAAREGKPLFLPPGRFEVSNIRLPSRLKLYGIPGETRMVYTGGGALMTVIDAENVSIDGVVFDGANRALAEHLPALLHFIGLRDLTFERCEVVGASRHALAFEGVSGRVVANRISGARESALWSVGATGLSVIDNHVADCGDGGILIHRWEPGEDNTIVARNRVERIAAKSGGTGQNGNGINVFRAQGVVIADNHVSDCAFSAIRSNGGSNVQIIGNQCLRSGETAVYSEFAFEGAVINSNVIDGASIGISVANFNEGGRLASVQGNLVRNLRTGAPYPDEMGLDFGIGISIEADTAVTGNVVEGAPSLAMLMGWGPFVRNIAATGNIMRDCRRGIGVSVVEEAGQVMISGNVFSDIREGAVVGMRWADFVTGDLAREGAGEHAHISIGDNRLG